MNDLQAPLDPEKYEMDEDGLPRAIVGPWAADKYARLARYIDISRSVRRKFVGPGKAGASYIDLYSGPGRVRIKDEQIAQPGSPLVAWSESAKGRVPFTQVHIADSDALLLKAAEQRLQNANAPVLSEIGPAAETLPKVLKKLNPHGLHVALLDPYNLRAVPFEVVRMLAEIKHMDILIHVSLQDLQRNLRRYIDQKTSPIDIFAPGWRAKVDTNMSDPIVRGKILEHWRNLVRGSGMATAECAELVLGPANQRLYLLAFVARHTKAIEFWEKIREIEPAQQQSLI